MAGLTCTDAHLQVVRSAKILGQMAERRERCKTHHQAFVLISTVVSTLLGLAAILLLKPFGIRSIPAGPYGIIFSL